MMHDAPHDATALLDAISVGDHDAKNKLFAMVYKELRALAHTAMRKENPGHTLQTTALVHEAYLRLVPSQEARWKDRKHFFRVAARAMRNILTESARKKRTVKRGAGKRPAPLDPIGDSLPVSGNPGVPLEDLEALGAALEKLAVQHDERLCTLVELRYFVGLSMEETANALDFSIATIHRDWKFTKAWLHKELRSTP